MNIEQYSVLALRTAPKAESILDDRIHAAMGVAGEAGEVADIIKKCAFYGKALDTEKLILELGDVLWYINLMISTLGITWSDVLEANIKKLEARYPDLRFDANRAINKDEAAELGAVRGA